MYIGQKQCLIDRVILDRQLFFFYLSDLDIIHKKPDSTELVCRV